MSKYRLTTLSPVHISSGEEYEINYNLLQKDGLVYIYDEFKLVEFFIAHDISVPSNIVELKKLILDKQDDIISSNLHIRKIESSFTKVEKPLLEQIATADFPIVTGSSIKGSLRTAILDCMTNNQEHCKNLVSICKDKSFDDNRFKKGFDNDLAKIFKYLKITDSMQTLETKVYKTINLKKDKSHQQSREKKVENIANFVEAIKPNQSFEIEIKDIHEKQIFQNLAWICNNFYIPFFKEDESYYFSKKIDMVKKVKESKNDAFIINVGRFGGAESKSLNNIRYIKASKSHDKTTTTARTFALEESCHDTTYFEHELIPFGWVMVEKIKESTNSNNFADIKMLKKEKFEAVDKLNIVKQNKIKEQKTKTLQKQKAEEEARKKEEEEKAKREAELAVMSPLELKLHKLSQENPNIPTTTLIFNNIKNGNLDEFKFDALMLLKELMQNNKEWKELSNAKKPEKDKNYQRTLSVVKLLNECD